MKTLYIDCSMGAAGDMLTAALLDLFPDPENICRELNNMGIPDVAFHMEAVQKCGIAGKGIHVHIHGQEEEDPHPHEHRHEHNHNHDHNHDHEHDHEHEHAHHHAHTHGHHHSSMADIQAIIESLCISRNVKDRVLRVYASIAQAESLAHGVEVSQVHFHEVGAMDAIADITAVCFLMEKLNPEAVIVSPVTVGFGQIHCAHGILPIPAPATANLLKNIPIRSGEIQGELCTPTGAALLKEFAHAFSQMPPMTVETIGYGMGKRDFPAANCVRILLGNQ